MFGRAPVLDFDGTIARLDIDWVDVRRRLGVTRIEELWGGDPSRWDVVTDAERRAAAVAAPVALVTERLATVSGFAVLTSNSSRAVHAFVDRFPELKPRLKIVVGRDELAGPKTDFEVFRAGLRRCLEVLTEEMQQDVEEETVFVGDAPYELAFATRLGLRAFDVADLGESAAGAG